MGSNRFRSETRDADRWSRVFEAIAAEPRRQLVVSLVDAPADRHVSLPEAASPSERADLDELAVELRHRHLPLLAEHGYVRWDAERCRARRGPHFEELVAVVESLRAEAFDGPDALVDGGRTDDRQG